MRTMTRLRALAAVLVCSAGLAACHDIERHFAGPGIGPPPPLQATRSAPRPRPVVKRVVRPPMVNAGARIRNFCTQRHVRFQSGTLRETETEKARNDVLCRQEQRG